MKKLLALFFTSIYLLSCGNQKQNKDSIPEYETFKIESKEVGEKE